MKKGDAFIIAIVLVLAVAVYFGNQWIHSGYDEMQVEILVGDELVYQQTLTDSLSDEWVMDDEDGYNRVVIEKGVVQMIEADCRDQVCVLSKQISQPGESIVCLPHEVIVRIVGGGDSEVDVISN